MAKASVVIAAYARGWLVRRRFRKYFRANAAPVILRNLLIFQKKAWLRRVAAHLPPLSPTDKAIISAPLPFRPAARLLEEMFHNWRCLLYRERCSEQMQMVLREKHAASQVRADAGVLWLKKQFAIISETVNKVLENSVSIRFASFAHTHIYIYIYIYMCVCVYVFSLSFSLSLFLSLSLYFFSLSLSLSNPSFLCFMSMKTLHTALQRQEGVVSGECWTAFPRRPAASQPGATLA